MARLIPVLLALLAVLAATVKAQQDLQDMLKYMDRLPKCAITCILQEVPKSNCISVTNSTCLCTDEPLRAATQRCVMGTCTSTLNALEAAKVEAEACQRPNRDRRYIVLTSIPIQALTAAFVVFRMYARWSIVRKYEADDWVMAVCLALYIVFCVVGTLVSRLAFGMDIWMVEPDNLTRALKYFYIAQSFYTLCLGLTKMAFLAFFLRIFPSETFRRITWAMIICTGLATATMTFLTIFQCVPVSFNWEGWKGGYGPHRCLNINGLAFSSAAFSIAQDVIIIIMPMPMLLRLQVSWRTKAGIVLMFSLGVFILITSCIRLRYIFIFAKSWNPTWDYVDAIVWSGVEISVSMIVVSLPPIRLYLSRVLPNVFSSIASRTGWSFGSNQTTFLGEDSHRGKSPARPINTTDSESAHQRRTGGDVEKASRWNALQHMSPSSKLSNFSFYGLGTNPRSHYNESEEALELGDRIKGEVHTSVRVDGNSSRNNSDAADFLEEDSSHSETGIRVHTTTTINTTYDIGRSDMAPGKHGHSST